MLRQAAQDGVVARIAPRPTREARAYGLLALAKMSGIQLHETSSIQSDPSVSALGSTATPSDEAELIAKDVPDVDVVELMAKEDEQLEEAEIEAVGSLRFPALCGERRKRHSRSFLTAAATSSMRASTALQYTSGSAPMSPRSSICVKLTFALERMGSIAMTPSAMLSPKRASMPSPISTMTTRRLVSKREEGARSRSAHSR
mmetsp:Transcript_28102/g.76706  ORF Transcript_28102/g.76706 Transcript_28102/m.76706 type:complete len:202 (+) Transcript_28102:321-926(+)